MIITTTTLATAWKAYITYNAIKTAIHWRTASMWDRACLLLRLLTTASGAF